jgi:RimJ/RimL family protein N-acetyltransferase
VEGEPLTTGDEGFRRVFTERLDLRALTLGDLGEVHALMSDPRVWTHFPPGVHTDPGETAQLLEREELGWELDGLGYWSARLRGAGTFVGTGGCRLYSTAVWNLYYRIRPEMQRKGYATELARAALAAARSVEPTVPVVASVLEHNRASCAVARAVGLKLVWKGPEYEGMRLLLCDRDVDVEFLLNLREHL